MKQIVKLFFLAITTMLFVAGCASVNTSLVYAPATPVISNFPTIFDVDIDKPASSARMTDARPNIIVILTDDQPFHTVDYMPAVKNQLMAGGVVFENGYVTTPLCCPSRASIFSGQYVHNHKVYTDRMPLGGALKFDASTSVSNWLQEAGYRTAYFGKYLNGYEDVIPKAAVPSGWDEWSAFFGKNISANDDTGNLQYFFNFSMSENGEVVKYPKSDINFSTDVITNKALAFIRDERESPFFMMVGYYNPHSPYISAPRHKETFRTSGNYWDWIQYRPPNFNEEDIRDKPDYIGDLSPLSPDEIDVAHKQILRSLLSVDDGVASIISALKKAGLDKNTIILYVSDNGLTLGDHRFGVTKNCPYEACVKIPFIVYAPGYYQPRIDNSHIVANIDIAPTIANWAGISSPDYVDGLSMLPILEDPASKWRDEILFEHWPTEEGVGSIIPEFYSIRTMDWKYTEYSTGEVELYDLVNDPYELENVTGKRGNKQIQAELALRLQKLKAE